MAIITPGINKNIGPSKTSAARQTVGKVSGILSKKNKDKKDILSRTFSIKRKREESDRRNQTESQLEAVNALKLNLFSPIKMVGSVTGGIFQRMLKVMGLLAAGWIMRNLPTWISMGKEFIARIQETGRIMKGFVSNVSNLFLGFGNVLKSIGQNIITFDLTDSNNNLSSAFDELLGTINDMGSQIQEAFGIFTTPLSEGKYSGENAPPPGSNAPSQLYERPRSGGTSGAYDVASKIGANREQWDIYRNTLAQIESGGRYDIPGGSGKHYDGRYQMGAAAKEDAARILGIPYPGHSDNPNDPKRVAFRKNPQLQERMFAAYTLANHGYLTGNNRYDSKGTVEQKLQVLGYAHNQGAGGAANWLRTGVVGRDGFNTKGTRYSDALARNFKGKVNPYQDNKISSEPRQQSSRQVPNINQSSLPKLPPTDTLGGGVQRYGAWRRGGRRHAGVDFDISGNQKFFSRIGGKVTRIDYDPGGYGNYIDIYNQNLGVYERIAEAARILVRKDQVVNPGEAVVQGESPTGVVHYEIRKNSGFGFDGTVNPTQFLSSPKVKSGEAQIAEVSSPSSLPQEQQPELEPERTGPLLLILDDFTQQSQTPSVVSSPSSSISLDSQVTQSNLLNTFMKNKLLLDLAYL